MLPAVPAQRRRCALSLYQCWPLLGIVSPMLVVVSGFDQGALTSPQGLECCCIVCLLWQVNDWPTTAARHRQAASAGVR